MKVSVITACYNSETTIEETIRSVARQTHNNIEFIIIDGNSKDNTLQIIEKYRNSVSVLISEPDNGVYNAMNKGITSASGDLVFFLNSDDIFINEKVVETFANFAKENKEGLLLGNVLMLNKYTGELYYENHKIVDRILMINSTIFHPATFFRREVFDKCGLYNETYKITSDYEWYIKYLEEGGDFKYFDTPVSLFSLGEGLSSDSNYVKLHQTERKKIRENYYNNFELKTVDLLNKFFPRKINKTTFRKNLAKWGLNKVY